MVIDLGHITSMTYHQELDVKPSHEICKMHQIGGTQVMDSMACLPVNLNVTDVRLHKFADTQHFNRVTRTLEI